MTPRNTDEIVKDILHIVQQHQEKIFILSNLVLDMSLILFKDEEFPSKEQEDIRNKLKNLSS